MYKFQLLLILSIFVIFACGDSKKKASDQSISKEARQIESESNLSAACEKDLKKYAAFLDDAKELLKKHTSSQGLSEAEEKEWEKKSRDMAKEFATSATAYTDPNCALAISKVQGEFTKVMMEMAQSRIQ